MTEMIEVTKEDANNYCRVLTALGMEEEGDPVAAIHMLENQIADRIRAAARLANAIKDINNLIGEMPEVQSAVSSVEIDIEHYSGLENCEA